LDITSRTIFSETQRFGIQLWFHLQARKHLIGLWNTLLHLKIRRRTKFKSKGYVLKLCTIVRAYGFGLNILNLPYVHF